MKTKWRPSKGFTLMEMLIVIAIITILVAVSIPIFSGLLAKTRAATCAANRRSLKALLVTTGIDGDEAAVKKAYDDHIDEFVCPSGGTISYTYDPDSGIVTVTCSVKEHQDESAATKTSGASDVYSNLYHYYMNNSLLSLKTTINSGSLSNTSSTAYKWYSSLSAEQKKILDQYNWSIQPASGSVRVFFADKANNAANTPGAYKYKYDTETGKVQYQYNPYATVNSSGVLKDTGHGSSWGAYDTNGEWKQNLWSDTMPGT